MLSAYKPIIITIDDDPIILSLLISVLKTDYGVRPFTSGKTALEFLVKNHVDLVILDCQMPDMSGLEVLAALREDARTQSIPVIFLTGEVDAGSEVEALEHGAADYITKPIRHRSLLTRVRLQLELQSHRRKLEALVEERTRDMQKAFTSLKKREEITLRMLARATDMRDHETGDHIERTTDFVRIITEDVLHNPREGYILTNALANDIIRSSKLHDLGKIALPDEILRKPGRLTVAEFSLIKAHSVHGARFLSEFAHEMEEDSFLDTARDIAYAHHERWDGSGYPLGLRGESIPLPARIVTIADVYDALMSIRPYKRALSHEEALRIVLDSAGSHFDPYLVTVFERHSEEFKRITADYAAKRASSEGVRNA